jgi:hypothetical protein
MFRSYGWEELSESQRQALNELGVGLSDTLYIKKRPPLTDARLVSRCTELEPLSLDISSVARSIASETGFHPKTIARRIKRLCVDRSQGEAGGHDRRLEGGAA